MANTLRFKRGLTAGLPASVAGEPLFTTDTFDLYIGNGTTNTRFQKYIASGTTLQYLRGDGTLATFPVNPITGTGASGQVAYFTGASTHTGSNNLFWDATNNRLGIGTTTPSQVLHINNGAIQLTDSFPIRWGTSNLLYGSTTGLDITNTSFAVRFRFTVGGNFIIGSTTDTTEKLQVNGTMKVTGASTFGGNLVISKSFDSTVNVNSTTDTSYSAFFHSESGTAKAYWEYINSNYTDAARRNYLEAYNIVGGFAIYTANVKRLDIASTGAATFSSSVTAGGNLLLTNGGAASIGAINLIRTGTSPVASRLTFGTDGTGYSFAIGKNQAGSVTDLVSILDSGAANFSSSIQAATAIAIGTTPDTNKPFKILKNINTTVGINFENTSTSSLAFSAIQMGTDVTGGTKFTNLVYASSGVTANGVYNPDGTSLINNGGGGLNFLGTPTRFYTGGSNGVLRLLFDNEGTTQYNATAPTTNATDGYKQYSADVVAGNAAPHFRTENGAVIKIYQETTGVGNAIISLGGGSSVLDDTTFDGYTLRQIVKALRNQGILA